MSNDGNIQQYLENDYALGRGYSSSLRLNFQHHLLHDLLGYSIHPSILTKANLLSNPRIPDVGTSTGQWLIDASKEIPSAQLDGFDISRDQYPNKAWLPSRISLHKLDIRDPIPSSMEGKYDMVHVQIFVCVVQNDGPMTILKELYKMPKPGGFLQWVEHEPASFKIVSPEPSLKRSATEQLIQMLRGTEGFIITCSYKEPRWPSNLPSHFESTGFEQVTSDAYPLPPELYAPFMQIILCGAEEMSFTARNNDHPGAQGPELRKLMAEVYKECQTGVNRPQAQSW